MLTAPSSSQSQLRLQLIIRNGCTIHSGRCLFSLRRLNPRNQPFGTSLVSCVVDFTNIYCIRQDRKKRSDGQLKITRR